MKIKTKKGKEFYIGWIGVASIDGALRFSLLNADLAAAFAVFTDKSETVVLTVEIDGTMDTYSQFTLFKSIDMNADGSIIIALDKEH